MHIDGKLDPDLIAPFPNIPSVFSLALQPDGGVIVGGSFRLNADGTRDGGFRPPEFSGIVESVGQQSDGKLIVGGSATVNGVVHNGMERLQPDGALDSSFLDGLSEVSRKGFAFVGEIALQADGKTLVGGDFSVINGVVAAGIARLWGSADIPSRVRSLTRSASELTITWDALTHRTYRVQSKDSISTPWVDLPGDVAGSSSGIGSKADSGAAKTLERFYRVVLLPDQR